MEGNNKQYDQNKQEQPISIKSNVALTGFIGGVFWCSLGFLASYFNFIQMSPRVLLSGFTAAQWNQGFIGFLLTVLICGALSIGVAFLYYWLLRRTFKLYVGIFYGIAVWAAVHFLLASIFPDAVAIGEMNIDSLVTTICLYILYGVFIGFSISFDESERQRMEAVKKQNAHTQDGGNF